MIQLLGIPYDLNSSFLRGPSYAPPRIRLADTEGSANRFTENGLDIRKGEIYEDQGDLAFEDPTPKKVFETIKSKVTSLIARGNFQMVDLYLLTNGIRLIPELSSNSKLIFCATFVSR